MVSEARADAKIVDRNRSSLERSLAPCTQGQGDSFATPVQFWAKYRIDEGARQNLV